MSDFKPQFLFKLGHLREYTFFVCLVNLQAFNAKSDLRVNERKLGPNKLLGSHP
jgi:hypothetical protein